MRYLIATLAICLLPLSNVGQTKPTGFDSKHLEMRYDKFRDQTIINAKPMNAAFEADKKKYLCSMAIGYSVRNSQKTSMVIMFAPGGSGFLAHLARSMDPGIARVFFSPNADMILLVGDNRYPLKRVGRRLLCS